MSHEYSGRSLEAQKPATRAVATTARPRRAPKEDRPRVETVQASIHCTVLGADGATWIDRDLIATAEYDRAADEVEILCLVDEDTRRGVPWRELSAEDRAELHRRIEEEARQP